MNADQRREKIIDLLNNRSNPLSAGRLSELLGVSRQIIVGDIALLRASGTEILATARGYLLSPMQPVAGYIGKVACRHNEQQTRCELYTIVDLGAQVLDVTVEHDLYGELTGTLNLACRADVDAFLQRAQNSKGKLLSELTGGVHLHSLLCRDTAHFAQARDALNAEGLLYQ